ncbi:MAG: hypothetical protein QXI32_00870 [Candidatus Bathyarchaeia archaeon]
MARKLGLDPPIGFLEVHEPIYVLVNVSIYFLTKPFIGGYIIPIPEFVALPSVRDFSIASNSLTTVRTFDQASGEGGPDRYMPMYAAVFSE